VARSAGNAGAQLLRRRDATTIRRLVIALDEPFRETFVLREIHNLSYREIADIIEAPVGTVMSASRAPAPCSAPHGWRNRAIEMTCDEAEILLHALIDGELDAGHAREVEDHIAAARAAPRSLLPIGNEQRPSRRRSGYAARPASPAHRSLVAADTDAEPAVGARRFCHGIGVSAIAGPACSPSSCATMMNSAF